MARLLPNSRREPGLPVLSIDFDMTSCTAK